MEKEKKKRKYLVAFVLLSLYLSLLESIIPKPFPWMKLGLSNIVILLLLEKWDKKMAFEALMLRILIQALMLGTIFSLGFLVSLGSGVLSFLLTIGVYRFREQLSLVAISCLSAVFHNAIQLVIVYFLMFRNISIYNRAILAFVFLFLALGMLAGLLTGILVSRLRLRTSREGMMILK